MRAAHLHADIAARSGTMLPQQVVPWFVEIERTATSDSTKGGIRCVADFSGCPSAWVSGMPWVGPAILCRIGQWVGLERARSLQVKVNRAPRLVRTADFRDFGSACSRADWRFRPEVKVTGKRRKVQNHQFRQSTQALRAGDKSRTVWGLFSLSVAGRGARNRLVAWASLLSDSLARLRSSRFLLPTASISGGMIGGILKN